MCLDSNASHYYEKFLTRKPFPIVVDLEDMLKGFDTIQSLASSAEQVIPGHDPLVTELYPQFGQSGFIWRLDRGAENTLPVF